MKGISVTGGTLFVSGGFNYRLFTGNGTLGVAGGSITADILVIAGGGGGGAGAGAGAGGLLLHSSQSLTAANYTVTIGSGGSAGFTNAGTWNDATNGSNSQFGALTASVGGGLGARQNAQVNGGNGGSGGGGSFDGVGGNPTSGQGFAGGGSTQTTIRGCGGGGGAAQVGFDGTTTAGGNGGNGTNSYSTWASATSTGVSGYFAGGGGGGNGAFGAAAANGGTAGLGGGGDSSLTSFDVDASPGVANTGGGGGGLVSRNTSLLRYGGAGGSGLVIVKWAV